MSWHRGSSGGGECRNEAGDLDQSPLPALRSRTTSPDLDAQFGFLGHGKLSALTLWDREDPTILPNDVGGEVNYRLRRVGMRNTLMGGQSCV